MSMEDDVFNISLNTRNIEARLTQMEGTLGQLTADQYIANLDIANLNAKTPQQGQATMANSSPVVIASDQISDIATEGTAFGIYNAIIAFDSKFNILGQTDMAASQPVVIASDQSAILVDGSAVTQPVEGTGTAGTPAGGVLTIQGDAAGTPIPVTGLVTGTNQSVAEHSVGAIPTYATLVGARNPVDTFIPLNVDASGYLLTNGGFVTQPVYTDQLPPTQGQYTMANSTSVVIASNQTAIPVSGTVSTTAPTSSTGTRTDVAEAVTDSTILAANAARKGAIVFNDSGTALKLLLAAGTSSSTNFTVLVAVQTSVQIPFGYTGIIKGIWTGAGGFARITEFT